MKHPLSQLPVSETIGGLSVHPWGITMQVNLSSSQVTATGYFCLFLLGCRERHPVTVGLGDTGGPQEELMIGCVGSEAQDVWE